VIRRRSNPGSCPVSMVYISPVIEHSNQAQHGRARLSLSDDRQMKRCVMELERLRDVVVQISQAALAEFLQGRSGETCREPWLLGFWSFWAV
jgi:hypothetical protein